MAKSLKVWRTLIASAKLEEIYEYTCNHWGETVAEKYLMDIEAVIQQAALDRGGLKRNPQYSARFTYSPARRHLIFFDVKIQYVQNLHILPKTAKTILPNFIILIPLFQFNEKEILQDSGKTSHEVAVALAESEYEKY